MRFAVIVFPGTWSDLDCWWVLREVFEQQVDFVWHKERDLSRYDCAILPGGFSFGDYLRPGAIARFSPIMDAVHAFAQRGRLVLGICNGFQILCEAGLLPGALLRNDHLEFRCQWVHLRVEHTASPFTSACRPGQVLRIPISHGEGRYYADPDTLAEMERNGQVLFRYSDPQGRITPQANPNGSLNNIAGVVNRQGNVLGMMPHPERCCETDVGGTDGRFIFLSILQSALQVVTG
ncbi:MAG: phosphoribosylformylglycinamidine synthase subunit PurQ [Dehalococcoidia bacterium]|nr:phosphoribosylformylglycinamidine synthase subunit PurQ [Dehalococcoidia bacterium]MDW8120447.1 phosphoribosylformylglycinamidine synthase subunit PurQ [Chloroflexota bacterium]